MGEIQAVADKKGTFLQGSSAAITVTITDIDGGPLNPDTISTTIYDSEGDIVETGTPAKVSDGFYVYEWEISSDQAIGEYSVLWRYNEDDEEFTTNQSVDVSDNATLTTANLYYQTTAELIAALNHHISYAQAIPIYNEEAASPKNRTTYRFTFPRWNQTRRTTIFRNNEIVDSGILINYYRGEVTFDSPLSSVDIVKANYNFRWFDDEDLLRFLDNAIQLWNSYPPHTNYQVWQVPDRFVPGVLYKAAADALRHLMLSINWQEPAIIFGGKDAAERVFSNLETLKKNFEADWKVSFENKKLGPYPRIKAILGQNMSLPGGRSRWFRYLFGSGS